MKVGGKVGGRRRSLSGDYEGTRKPNARQTGYLLSLSNASLSLHYRTYKLFYYSTSTMHNKDKWTFEAVKPWAGSGR